MCSPGFLGEHEEREPAGTTWSSDHFKKDRLSRPKSTNNQEETILGTARKLWMFGRQLPAALQLVLRQTS